MDGPVWKERGQRHDMIRGHAVLQAVWTAGILGDVSADGARRLARWIRRVVQAVWSDRASQRAVHHTRLDDGETIVVVDRKDIPQPVQPDQDDAVCECAT